MVQRQPSDPQGTPQKPEPLPGSNPPPAQFSVDAVKSQGKDFINKAKAGTLDEASLRWGLSAGAVISGVSLLFNYMSWDFPGYARGGTSGLDLLSFHGGGFLVLKSFAIPVSAFFALYLHFGEPTFKALNMELPGRAKLVYLIGMIVAGIGVLGCLTFLGNQVCLGSTLGLVGLGLLTFVYFKLWNLSPAA